MNDTEGKQSYRCEDKGCDGCRLCGISQYYAETDWLVLRLRLLGAPFHRDSTSAALLSVCLGMWPSELTSGHTFF